MELPRLSVVSQHLTPPVPVWVFGWFLPELASINRGLTGQSKFSLFTHPNQSAPRLVKGFAVLEHLAATDLLTRCLSFYEGRALVSNDLPAHFVGGKHLMLWRSVAYDDAGNLFVPFIQNIVGQFPVIYWWWLEYNLYETHLAPLCQE